jgi:hypothetical protein
MLVSKTIIKDLSHPGFSIVVVLVHIFPIIPVTYVYIYILYVPPGVNQRSKN